MDPRLHQHRGAASVLGLLLALMAVTALVVLVNSLPAQGQSVAPMATPAPTATAIIPPDAPTVLTPVDGDVTTGFNYAPLGMPTFSWALPPGATLSHIQISNTQGFSVLWVDEDTEGTTYTPSAVWPDGSYYWRVKVATGPSGKRLWGDYTAVQSFNKDWSDVGQIRPALVEPPNGQERSSFRPGDFTWTPIAGAAGYLFEIASDANFATIVYKTETIKARHTPTVRLGSRLSPNYYYWRVTPFAYTTNVANRAYGAPSDTGTFTINWLAPPQQLAPADDLVTPFLPRFQWQAIEGAKTYELQINTDSSFSPNILYPPYKTSNTEFTPPSNLPNDKEYFWRVKATDQNGNETQWSTVRSFRVQWDLSPKLLTPANNQIQLSYPLFSWEPVPGAEQYQIQIDDTNQFAGILLADEKIYNATTYAHPDWSSVPLAFDAYWRVRAIDASNNYTPWSETRSFRTGYTVAPNLIYPPYSFAPDTQNLPVYRTPTLAWPVFVWDTSIMSVTVVTPGGQAYVTLPPDYYWLMVDDEPSFSPPVSLSIKTRTLGAAPVLYGANADHTFTNLRNGTIYYWRVQAFRDGAQMGMDARWEMRYDGTVSDLTASPVIAPTYPRDGYQAVGSPPVLGWLPVIANGTQAANNYHVQISRTPDFTAIVDEAYPQFVNYVPWQGRDTEISPGVYWWRVRAESGQNAPIGDWSTVRSFAVSLDLLYGNNYDFHPPIPPKSLLAYGVKYVPELTQVAATLPSGDEYGLDKLHVMIDRSYVIPGANLNLNLNWALAFNINPSPGKAVRYGIYVDKNHLAPTAPCANLAPGAPDAGGTTDPIGQTVTSMPLYAPEYVLYVDWNGSAISAVNYYRWNGVSGNPKCQWAPAQELTTIGGWYWYDATTQSIELLVPYTSLGGADDDFSGSLALTVFSTGVVSGDGIHSSVPFQGALPGNPANYIDNPIFLSDMLEPLYPFDMPLSNPQSFQDMPPLRWRMPVFDSVDGYQLQLARDEGFSQVIETWETFESQTWDFFALMPATFQSLNAIADNESYYWRVRIRHEKRDGYGAYDYGPWSPPQRFKLDSRLVGNPRLSTGSDVFMTPTFEWDRVEGAASYRLQVDDDPLFGTPLLDVSVDGTSYTPQETAVGNSLSSHITYYWRVAIRRSDTVLGAWTPAMPLDKNSVTPVPLSPLTSNPPVLFTETPTFAWTAVLTPTESPRLAAPLYQLQVDNNADFKSPEIDISTTADTYTPIKGKSLADGTWYWRVAMYEATGKPGPWSEPQTFDKQYPLLTPVAPISGGSADKAPRFSWLTAPGAAYYVLEVAQDSGFQNPSKYTTSNTSYTVKDSRKNGVYYWRVKMVDHDGKEGPILPYRFNLGQSCYIPFLSR